MSSGGSEKRRNKNIRFTCGVMIRENCVPLLCHCERIKTINNLDPVIRRNKTENNVEYSEKLFVCSRKLIEFF